MARWYVKEVVSLEEFLSKAQSAFGYAEKLDVSFGKWDSRMYSPLVSQEKKIIVIAHKNRTNYGNFDYDIITSDRLISYVPVDDIFTTIEQLVMEDVLLKEFEKPTNLKSKNFITTRLTGSGYYLNYLNINNENVHFGENDMRKWIVSVNPNGSSVYLIRYKDGTFRYYDGGQNVPLYCPKIYTESTEVLAEDLHYFGCVEKCHNYCSDEWKINRNVPLGDMNLNDNEDQVHVGDYMVNI